MASNVFYQFDVGKQNIMSNYDFSNHSQRQNGVGTGAALSSLHNKLFYQVSTITSALAEVMKNNGYDMGSSVESSWATTVTQLSNIVTKAFLTANHYTKTETQSYVTGLLALYDLSTVVDEKISAAISAIDIEGGGATIANINDAINNAFNTSGSTTTLGGTTFYSKRATETEIQNGSGGNYICPSSLKAAKWVPILDPSAENYLIYSQGGAWVRMAWSSLSTQFVSADTSNLTNYYTKTYIDTNYYKKTEVYTKQEASDNFQTAAEVNTQISSFGYTTKTYVDGQMLGVGQSWSVDSTAATSKSATAGSRPIMVSVTFQLGDTDVGSVTINSATVANFRIANGSGTFSSSYVVPAGQRIEAATDGSIIKWSILS